MIDEKNGDQRMKSLNDIPYFLLVTASVAIVWGFFAAPFFAGSVVHHKAEWGIFGFYTLMCILGIVVHGVLSVRSRGLGYSATTREYNAALRLAGERASRKGAQMDNRTGIAILFGIAGTVIGACVSSFLITGHWLYPPTTTPADTRHIYGFAALSCFICVFVTMRLIKRGEIRISE